MHPEAQACCQPGEQLVLYDGHCRLCNAWITLIIRHDTQRRFRLADVRSAQGKALLRAVGLPDDVIRTLVLIGPDQVWLRAQAVFRVMAQVSGPWRGLGYLRWLPAGLCDPLYNLIARYRYRLFGEQTQRPQADHARRFVSSPHDNEGISRQ